MRAPAELRPSPRHSAEPEPRAASRPSGRVSTGAAVLPFAPAVDPLPEYDRPAETLLEQGTANGCAYRIEIRPGMAEGQYLGLALSMWGDGHWVRRDGESHYYTRREHAHLAALRWLESGR